MVAMVKMTVRLPDKLHAQLLAYAGKHIRSLNSEIIALLTEAVKK